MPLQVDHEVHNIGEQESNGLLMNYHTGCYASAATRGNMGRESLFVRNSGANEKRLLTISSPVICRYLSN